MKKVSLNGIWKFTKETLTKENFQTINWEEVNVPHTWNGIDGQNGGNNYYRGLCWYHKSINIEKNNGRVFLEFEGVNSVATVLLNGTLLGMHKGGYSTFRFDITDIANEGENLLIVGADNKHYEDVFPLLADFTFYGGIYRDSYIVYTNNVAFDLDHVGTKGVYVSQTDISHEVAKFSVDAYLKNYASKKDVTVNVKLNDAVGKTVLTDSKNLTVDEKGMVSFSLELNNPHLWNGIDDPYLYVVELELVLDGKTIDSRSINTGFRFYKFDETYFYLNGKQMKLNGVSRHQDRWQVGNALTNEMHEEDMSLIKEVGANSIRLAHYQQADYFYDLCDKEGMIIWAEIPYITVPSKTDKEGINALSQMEELVKQNYNHSSIIMWGVQNETTATGKKNNLEAIVQKLHNLTKEIDPYRVTVQAQISFNAPKDTMNEITDVLGFNHYFGWYGGAVEDFTEWLEEYRKLNPTRPLCLSEYGVEGIIRYHTDTPEKKDYTEEYHALWHETAYNILNNLDYVWGTYVWNMFAFAADFRDEGGVKGLNNKGLITIDRKIKKDAFYYYKAMWSKEPMVHLNSKRFVERHNKDIVLKAYSNQGEVLFFLNDKLVDTVKSEGAIFTTKVTLAEGANKVVVKSGALSDSIKYITVEKENESYSVPENENKGIFDISGGDNWIDSQVDDDAELVIDPEYYSVNDPIEELLNNEGTLAVFKKYLIKLMDHPMFSVVTTMSIQVVSDFEKGAIPNSVFIKINQELQEYKKAEKGEK